MIPVCFPQSVFVNLDDGIPHYFLSCDPERIAAGGSIDSRCVYFFLEELLNNITKDFLNSGLSVPIKLNQEILNQINEQPCPLPEYLQQDTFNETENIRICLFNGGGGGLGDGIMFAPALKILQERLSKKVKCPVTIDVYSVYPLRTGIVLKAIPGINVKPLVLSLHDFLGYDAYADFSGMLLDKLFQNTNMTDYVLSKLGFVPEQISSHEKIPFLALPEEVPSEVETALKRAEAESNGKKLVAFIFRSALARTMPDVQAAQLIQAMAKYYKPVVIMSAVEESEQFIQQHQLSHDVVDLSAVSTNFENYFCLLNGMDAIVSVDTSAVHIGAALNKPTVALFNCIQAEQRILYYPSVTGIQLQYQGKKCKAPCGISKIKSFVRGKLPNGHSFCLEFGHACEESAHKEKLLDEITRQITGLDLSADINGQLKTIHRHGMTKFAESGAPCWQNLQIEQVLRSLRQVIADKKNDYRPAC